MTEKQGFASPDLLPKGVPAWVGWRSKTWRAAWLVNTTATVVAVVFEAPEVAYCVLAILAAPVAALHDCDGGGSFGRPR
jgi:hypothetical protein